MPGYVEYSQAPNVATDITSSTNATTTSTADPGTSMISTIPAAGKVMCFFNAAFFSSVAGQLITIYIYYGGVQIAGSLRQSNPWSSAALSVSQTNNMMTQASLVSDGVSTLEIRWKVSAGTGTVMTRTMTVLNLF